MPFVRAIQVSGVGEIQQPLQVLDVEAETRGDFFLPRAFPARVNLAMVGIEKLESPKEIAEVRAMIERHLDYTKSTRARAVLDQWAAVVPKFVKVMPKDYKRMLACIERAEAQGLTGDEAIMAAFEENARDTSRVGGN